MGAPDEPKDKHGQDEQDAQDAHAAEALDEGLEESFPASDPVAVSVTRVPDDAATPGAGREAPC